MPPRARSQRESEGVNAEGGWRADGQSEEPILRSGGEVGGPRLGGWGGGGRRGRLAAAQHSLSLTSRLTLLSSASADEGDARSVRL